tara:strand:- start:3029 stop:3454 length:426 start_codon:yes stop_codon:yes gene_type:complete
MGAVSLEITEVRNAVSLNAENTLFDCEINHPTYGWIPYTLNPDDEDNHVNNDDLRTLIGSDFTEYTAPTQEELDAQASALVRAERDNKLVTEVDPIVSNPLRWADLSTEKQNEWSTYRTALLNVPQQSGFPHNVVWPTKPD